jgi:hypothetical protein
VLQSLLARDLREVKHMAIALWPTFIEPLGSTRRDTTLENIRSHNGVRGFECADKVDILHDDMDLEALQKNILVYLDERIMHHLKSWISNNLYSMVGDHSKAPSTHEDIGLGDMPYLTKCLLLAGFICQHNSPETDKQLFTIHKMETKITAREKCSVVDAENPAFASTTWGQERLKMLRLRSYSLERMLSVFVSIIGLDQAQGRLLLPESIGDTSVVEPAVILRLGSGVFEGLAHLRTTGLLREIPHGDIVGAKKTSTINMTNPLYCCDLDRDTAEGIARSIHLPLGQYLL